MQTAELRLQTSSSDIDFCRSVMREGSKSFYAASRLLPTRIESSIAPLYAFCRVADDLIDEVRDPAASLELLHNRLNAIHRDQPWDFPVDRAFAELVHRVGIPPAVTDALLEGFSWEVQGIRLHTISDVRAYSARVASTVGVMATLIMGRRDGDTLARAADLGVAMQLTNIARDVGEDARRGRIYLPAVWLEEAGLDIDEWLTNPTFNPKLVGVVRRLIAHAHRLYDRAEFGIPRLPTDCRIAIEAARLIYADIGRVIADAGYDSVSRRAVTTMSRKLWLGLRASVILSKTISNQGTIAPLPETAFLVDAIGASDKQARGCGKAMRRAGAR